MTYSDLRAITFVAALFALLAAPADAARKLASAAHNVSLESVNSAEWRRGGLSTALLIKVQVLLDRAHASPGEIDASRGEKYPQGRCSLSGDARPRTWRADR